MHRTEYKARIEELRALKGDEALDSDGLDWLEEAFNTKYPEHLPLPCLDPDGIGGVFAEWDIEGYEVTLMIYLSSTRAYWNEKSEDRNVDYGKQLYLCDTSDWDWLIDRLSYLLPKAPAEQREEPK